MELLVVIAIIGVLVALLLPAIQAAREAARKSQCQNNMRQIGLAVTMFEQTNKEYPAGSHWSRKGIDHQTFVFRGNILLWIMPYLEQSALYDEFNFGKQGFDFDFQTALGQIGKHTISAFICPSDSEHPDHPFQQTMSNYSASAGPMGLDSNGNCLCNLVSEWNSDFSMTPYTSNVVTATSESFPGVFSRLGIRIKLRQITDGLSNTIFFGEARPLCSKHVRSGWTSRNSGQGHSSTIVPINFDSCSDDPSEGCGSDCTFNSELGFKSTHPGGAFFLLGDGSVHFLSQDIDMQTYQYLGARADGQVVADVL